MNKRGITLMELLAYLAIVSIVVAILTGTMTYAVKSYDSVNGQGALNSEANAIMSNLLNKSFSFNPDYAESCGSNCIDLVVDNKRVIDPDTGILKDVPVNETVRIKIDDATHSIYINNMKLNSNKYAVEPLDAQGNDNISIECSDNNYGGICQKFVIKIRLAIYQINSNGDKISKVAVYENRFSI